MYDWENDSARFDADALVAGANVSTGAGAGGDPSPEALVDRLLAVSLATPAHPARREELVRFASQQTSPAARADRTLSTLALITALPEYQLA
jgi:hypothetical protein